MGYTIREWQKKYKGGDFKLDDREVQVDAGWFDWLCDDDKLASKTKKLGGVVNRVKEGGKLDIDADTVSFLNDAPEDGVPPYDTVRFERGGEVVLAVSSDDKRLDAKWNAYDCAHGSPSTAAFSCDTVAQLGEWLNEPFVNVPTMFDVSGARTADELRAAAEKKLGVDLSDAKLVRVSASSRVEAARWVRRQLGECDGGVLYAALCGRGAVVGYCLE